MTKWIGILILRLYINTSTQKRMTSNGRVCVQTLHVYHSESRVVCFHVGDEFLISVSILAPIPSASSVAVLLAFIMDGQDRPANFESAQSDAKKRRLRRQLLEEAFQMSCRTSLELLNHMEHVVERRVKDDARAQRRIALREAASASAPNVAAVAFRPPRPPAGPPPEHLLKPLPPPPPAPPRLPKAPVGPPPWRKPPASCEGDASASAKAAASASCQRDAAVRAVPAVVPRAILKPRVFTNPVKTLNVPRVIPPTEVPASIPDTTLSAVRAPKEEVMWPTTHDEDGAAEGVVSAPVSVGLAEVLQETEQTIDPKEELFSPISDDGYGVA